jgi:hypothetical protein
MPSLLPPRSIGAPPGAIRTNSQRFNLTCVGRCHDEAARLQKANAAHIATAQ